MMKTQKLIGIITTVIIICLLSTCDVFSTKGRWNPLDPDYEASTDPEYLDNPLTSEFRWDFTNDTEGWSYGHSIGQSATGEEVQAYLDGRVICSQQSISEGTVLDVNVNTDSLTGHVTEFWIECSLAGSIIPNPYFSTRIYVSQAMIDTGSTIPRICIWGGDGATHWEANSISINPTSVIITPGWYNYSAQVTADSYTARGTPTFTNLSYINLSFFPTSNPLSGSFCQIEHIRLAATEDPDM